MVRVSPGKFCVALQLWVCLNRQNRLDCLSSERQKSILVFFCVPTIKHLSSLLLTRRDGVRPCYRADAGRKSSHRLDQNVILFYIAALSRFQGVHLGSQSRLRVSGNADEAPSHLSACCSGGCCHVVSNKCLIYMFVCLFSGEKCRNFIYVAPPNERGKNFIYIYLCFYIDMEEVM